MARPGRLVMGLALAGAAAVVLLPMLGNEYLVGTGLTVLMWLALTPSW